MKKYRKYLGDFFIALTLLAPFIAHAQTQPSVRQVGAITVNHCTKWAGNQQISDAGASCGGSSGSDIDVGTTVINSGTTTRVLFDNVGVVGEYAISGTGNVCMSTNCSMTTPALGTPSALVLTNATGTPSAIVLTNGTGLPISTGVSGLGTGIAAFLATPSSANLRTAVTDESGTGALIFAGSPTFTGTVTTAALTVAGNFTLSGQNLVTDTSTGSQIATGATQKLGFFGTTPAVQQTGNVCTGLQTLGLMTSCTESAGTGITINTTTITGGTTTRLLFDNAGTVGEKAVDANVYTFMATPSSANLAAALTNETGTGAAVFAGSPALTGTYTAHYYTWDGESRITSDLSKTDSTFSNSGLSVSLDAGKTYIFEIRLYVSPSGTTGGQKVDLNGGTATATSIFGMNNTCDSTSCGVAVISALNTVTCNFVTAAGNVAYCDMSGTIVVNGAGTFIPRFAQNVTNATASVLKAGSYMHLFEIP